MPIPKKSKKWNVLEFYTEDERDLLRSFADVDAVQRFLSDVPYSPDAFYRSPRAVMRDRKAHCFDGAVFAAAALEV